MHAVTLATVDAQFRGFVIQAREADGNSLIGTFTIMNSGNSQLLNCPGNGRATVSQSIFQNYLFFIKHYLMQLVY